MHNCRMQPSEIQLGSSLSWLSTLCQRLKHQNACRETTTCFHGFNPDGTHAYSDFKTVQLRNVMILATAHEPI